jgi:hypothetical protein
LVITQKKDSDFSTITIYNKKTYEVEKSEILEAKVNSFKIYKDKIYCALSRPFGNILIMSLGNFEEKIYIDGHSCEVTDLAHVSGFLITTDMEGNIKVWEDNKYKKSINDFLKRINTITAINTLNQVPLVNSTQIITSTQPQLVSQVPVPATAPVVSQVPVVQPVAQPVQSVVPSIIPDQHYATQTTLNTLVDEDYRLGRGILDDFRPNAYKAQIGMVGNTTTNIITSSTLPQTTTPLPAVSTPVTPNVNVNGASALKEFL